MNFGSVFTGIGGFDLGFEKAGLECAWQCEIDDKASAVLKRHWPSVRRYKDVKEIGKANLEPVDIICGGFPCQDLSIAGKRKGLDGKRSGLWFEFARIIDELEPGGVVIENVPGLLSSNKGEDFATIIQWLVKRGYGVCWRILDSQYFGVAQRRRRVFIVASFGNGNSAKVLFESEGMHRDPPARGKTGKGDPGALAPSLNVGSTRCDPSRGVTIEVSPTLRESIGGTVSEGRDAIIAQDTVSNIQARSHKGINSDGMDQMVAGTLNPGPHPGGFNGQDANSNLLVAGTLDAKSCASNRGSQANELEFLSFTVTSKWSKHVGGPSGSKSETNNLVLSPITTNPHADRVGEEDNLICWEMQHAAEAYREAGDISPNLQARMGTGGNNIPLVGVRRLTPTECERLQGFPDGWTDNQSDTNRYKQLGNAVTATVAEWIGSAILRVEAE